MIKTTKLVKAQRDEAMQYVTMDEDTLAQYREQLMREPGAPPENLSVTEAQRQAAHKKVLAWKAANAKTQQSRASVLMPDGAPPPAPKKCKEVPIPRQVSQHQRLFKDIYPQVTPIDPLAGSRITRQMDTDPMDMAQFTDLNLGGAPRNPFILDRIYQGIALLCNLERVRRS